jgi:hypothetical protein
VLTPRQYEQIRTIKIIIMMKDIIKKYEETYTQLPKLQVKKLWHHGYWDGPTSGVCEVDGKKCWFELIEEWHDKYDDYDDDDFTAPWYRRYLVHHLTDEQFKEIEARHEKFQRMVGTHTDYNEEGRRGNFHYNDTVSKETVEQYYKESKDEKFPDITPASEEHILGWYEW